MFDNNINRVGAFLKRLLDICLIAEPQFITCVLIVISQTLRNKHKLWKMLESNKQKEQFDFNKRDPVYTNASEFPLAELVLLTNHYHPTIQKFSNFILENYNKAVIQYEGDPLVDFSLVNFLDKFIMKNPKLKAKKPKQKKTDDEKLLDFIEEGDVGEGEEDKGENLDFIKTFNEFNKKKTLKKKKAKLDEVDIDEYADNIIEEEMNKYDKQHGVDIDEDDDIDFDNI
jgi:ribosome biogenesis protein MAK21